MILFWKISYLDRTDSQRKDRLLYLNTAKLDPGTRAAIELVIEENSRSRDILRYRHLFTEDKPTEVDNPPRTGDFSGRFVALDEYFEDETGKEITFTEMVRGLTGNPNLVALPSGAKPHDIEYMLGDQSPVPVADVALTVEEVDNLAYFCRDLKEMLGSVFMKNPPGALRSGGPTLAAAHGNATVETTANPEEIRSFVTIFRRLYMSGERANFKKAADVFTRALGNHRLGKWVAGVANDYQNHLDSVPRTPAFMQGSGYTFTTKSLLDAFIYTQYAHQPKPEKQRQFTKYLNEVNGQRAFLTWLFLGEIQQSALKMKAAGTPITQWFEHWCSVKNVTPNVLASLSDHHAGLGALEKREDRRARLFQEKVEQLARDHWEEAGRPAGGPEQFIAMAREELSRTFTTPRL